MLEVHAEKIHAEADLVEVIVHGDDETPVEFVVELLHSVFKKPIVEAIRVTHTADKQDKAICGIYPRVQADAMLEDARRRIRASGHSLVSPAKRLWKAMKCGSGAASCAARSPARARCR
jgi:ATP-dependent Clp protease adapter protein ClpS